MNPSQFDDSDEKQEKEKVTEKDDKDATATDKVKTIIVNCWQKETAETYIWKPFCPGEICLP